MGRNLLEPAHIVLILIIVLLLFGANRLPGLARSLGQSMKIFKNEVKGLRDEDEKPKDPPADADRTPDA